MSEILIQYEKIHPATWVYLSSLLMISLFFKFNRFWSVRNLDLILLILLAPGLLFVNYGLQAQSDAVAEYNAAVNARKPVDGVNLAPPAIPNIKIGDTDTGAASDTVVSTSANE